MTGAWLPYRGQPPPPSAAAVCIGSDEYYDPIVAQHMSTVADMQAAISVPAGKQKIYKEGPSEPADKSDLVAEPPQTLSPPFRPVGVE
jgi:hypothetical protein